MKLTPQWIRPVGALAMASALALGVVPVWAQDGTPPADRMDLSNAPIDMHEGTCAEPALDPWDEIGRLQRADLSDPEADGVLDEDVVVDGAVATDVTLTEDLDNDGVLDDGEDLNENGILDVGIDADGDGILGDEEIVAEGEAVVAVVNLPTVYTTQGEIDANFEAIFGQANVIAVHQSSEQYENIVACGNVGGVAYEDEEQVVVGLNAVGDSGVRGYAVFDFDPSIFGNEFTVVDVVVVQNLMTQREAMMAATPTP